MVEQTKDGDQQVVPPATVGATTDDYDQDQFDEPTNRTGLVKDQDKDDSKELDKADADGQQKDQELDDKDVKQGESVKADGND